MFNEKLPKRILLGTKKKPVNENEYYAGFTNLFEVSVLEFSPSQKYLKGGTLKDPTYHKWYDLVNDYEIVEILE